jgi:hypothetical protein
MSHIETGNFKYKDLEALEQAAKEFGAEFVRGKTKYGWYGTSVGDYPIPNGFVVADLGHCDHVIRLKGCSYEIGVVSLDADGSPTRRTQKPHSHYGTLYDFWGVGQQLKSTFGVGLAKLADGYQHTVFQRSLKPGQRCWKIGSQADADKVGGLLGGKINYAGKPLTIVARA